ncbi:MAG: hypothetical protein ACRC0V_01835 [Fusobacteriaceae bacterium]
MELGFDAEKFKGLARKNKNLIMQVATITAICFLIVYPIFNFLESKRKLKEFESRKIEISNKKNILAQKINDLKILDEENNNKKISAQEEVTSKSFKNSTELKNYLENFLEMNGLKTVSVSRTEIKQLDSPEEIFEMAVPLKITGDFFDLINFLKNVTSSKKFISLSKGDISLELKNDDAKFLFRGLGYVLGEKNIEEKIFEQENSEHKNSNQENSDDENLEQENSNEENNSENKKSEKNLENKIPKNFIKDISQINFGSKKYFVINFYDGGHKIISKNLEFKYKNQLLKFIVAQDEKNIEIKIFDKNSENIFTKSIQKSEK